MPTRHDFQRQVRLSAPPPPRPSFKTYRTRSRLSSTLFTSRTENADKYDGFNTHRPPCGVLKILETWRARENINRLSHVLPG